MVKCACSLDLNGIPCLSKIQLEKYGERVLRDFSPAFLKEPQATNLDSLISKYMGFNFEYQYLSHNQSYLGITIFNDTDSMPVYDPYHKRAEFISVKKNTIIIEGTLAESSHLEHRERFTQGHEIAHGLLHSEYFQWKAETVEQNDNYEGIYSQTFIPDLSEVDTYGRQLQGEAWLEWQANYLSAVLLMPKTTVKKLKNIIEPKGSPLWHFDLVREMVKVFKVSEEAARVRLQSLGYWPTNY